MKVNKKPIVAVDLDGTIIEYHGWKGFNHFGNVLPGARTLLKNLRKAGFVVRIYTVRTNQEVNGKGGLTALKRFLKVEGLEYDDIAGPGGKPIADAFIDDLAIPVKKNEGYSRGSVKRLVNKAKRIVKT